jgi:hypothetical protein
MPIEQVPLNYWALPLIEQYYRAKQISKANDLTQALFESMSDEARYYFKLKGNEAKNIESERQMCLYTLNQLSKITEYNKQKDLSLRIQGSLQGYLQTMNPSEQY